VQLLTYFADSLSEVLGKISDDVAEEWTGTALSPTPAASCDVHEAGLPLPTNNLHTVASFHLPFITVLGFLCRTPASEICAPGADSAAVPPPAVWTRELTQGHLARVWGARLAPVLDISVMDMQCALSEPACVCLRGRAPVT